MKKILILAAMCMSISAFAQEQYPATQTQSVVTSSGAVSNSQGGAGGASTVGDTSATGGTVSGVAATNAGNTNTIGCLVNCTDQTASTRDLASSNEAIAAIQAQAARDVAGINADAKIRNTPSVNGPPLVSSNDTCMGSASGSINAPGIGLALGKTYTDTNCVMLKNSRELWNMGMKAAALALMCNDPANRQALEVTGFTCPQTAKANAEAKPQVKPVANGEQVSVK